MYLKREYMHLNGVIVASDLAWQRLLPFITLNTLSRRVLYIYIYNIVKVFLLSILQLGPGSKPAVAYILYSYPSATHIHITHSTHTQMRTTHTHYTLTIHTSHTHTLHTHTNYTHIYTHTLQAHFTHHTHTLHAHYSLHTNYTHIYTHTLQAHFTHYTHTHTHTSVLCVSPL